MNPITQAIELLLLVGMFILFTSAFWIPVAFATYVTLGNGRFTLRALFVFITCESVGLGFLALFLWLLRNLDWHA